MKKAKVKSIVIWLIYAIVLELLMVASGYAYAYNYVLGLLSSFIWALWLGLGAFFVAKLCNTAKLRDAAKRG